MKILVTGCAGYIGRLLCEHFAHYTEHQVCGVDNLFYGQKLIVEELWGDNHDDKLKFVHADVWKDRVAVAGLAKEHDVIIPLAALVGESICDTYPLQAEETNTLAIEYLVRTLDKGQKVIFPTTTSSYGSTDGATVITEEHEQHPISLYGRTKKAAEEVVLKYPNSVSLRLGTVYGYSPRHRFDLLVNSFVNELVNNHKLVLFEGHFVRSIVNVVDIVRVIDFFAENKLTGVFNVSAESISKFDLAERICRELRLYHTKIEHGEGKDRDQRNYNISQAKLFKTGFRFRGAFEDAVMQLSHLIPSSFGPQLGHGRNI